MPIVIANPTLPLQGWDLSSATQDSGKVSPILQDDNSFDLFFKPDGTKMYTCANNTEGRVYQYSLGTAWDISTLTYDSVFISIETHEPNPYGMFMSPDGTALYITGQFNDIVRQYTLSTPWDLSTAGLTYNFYAGSEGNSPSLISFNDDGTKFYIFNNSTFRLFQYSAGSAWSISGASYDSVNKAFAASEAQRGMAFNDDGTKLFLVYQSGDEVVEYSMSPAWDITTLSSVTTLGVNPPQGAPRGVRFKTDDGSKMYLLDVPSGDRIYQWSTTS